MNLHEMTGHLIRRLHQTSTQVFQSTLQEKGYDLTAVQFATLHILYENQGLDQVQVAQLIAYDKATIGGVIDRLQTKGYVIRKPNPKDKRAKLPSLSPAGEKVYKEVLPIIQGLQRDILGNLNDNEMSQFLNLLTKAVGSPENKRA